MTEYRIYLIKDCPLTSKGRIPKGTPRAVFPWLAGQPGCLVSSGDNLRDFLIKNEINIPYVCGGKGVCRKCRIQAAAFCEDPDDLQFRKILACQMEIDRDLAVILPQSERMADLERIYFEFGAGDFAGVSRPNYKNFFTRNGKRSLGLAVDLGTTSIAAALVDLLSGRILGRCSVRNPQTKFGADIITRIGCANEGAEMRLLLQRLIFSALDGMISVFEEKCQLETGVINKIVLAGNSVMEYLFLGLDPSEMGEFPFDPRIKAFDDFDYKQLNFPKLAPLSSDLEIFCFPLFAGFVGGDIVSGIFSLGADLFKRNKTFLFFDIGTNGEIVLVRDGRILVTACAAGPAFEGAGIEFGMTGQPGAIDRADFELLYKLHVIGGVPPRGICGSGLVDLVAVLLRTETIEPNGRFNSNGKGALSNRVRCYGTRPAFLVTGGDYFECGGVGTSSFLADECKPIWLTQKDIRQVQLAVGAVRSGFSALLRAEDLWVEDLDRIYIAGDFGAHLQTENARRIGLIPRDSRPEQIAVAGNSSLAGAIALLVDPDRKQEISDLVKEVHFIDLSALPDFQDIFIESMNFPNT